MDINADSMSVSGAPLSGRLARRHAEARQGRWMLELERTMLASDASKAGAGAPPRPAAPSQGGPAAMPNPLQHEDADGTAYGAAAGPDDGATGESSRTPRAHPDVFRTGPVRLLPGVTMSDDLTVARHPLDPLMGATLLSAHPSIAAGLSVSGPGADASRLSLRAPLSAPGMGAYHLEHYNSEAHTESAERGGAAPHPSQFGERAVFCKQLLSLYVGKDGVHAYIRDAALGAGQAQRVAQALSGEMAAVGQKVAAVTVNGLPLVAADPLHEDDDFPGEVRDAQLPVFQHGSTLCKGHPK